MYDTIGAPVAEDKPIQIHLEVYCDDKALVERISRWRHLRWLYPNECLVNDFDASHELLIESKWFQTIT